MKNAKRFLGVVVPITTILMSVSFLATRSEIAYASTVEFSGVNNEKVMSTKDLPKAVIPKWTVSRSRSYVKTALLKHGWSSAEFKCTSDIVWAESRWKYRANNPHSTAFGLFQILKTPEHLGVEKQTERYIRYIEHRYGTPCKALKVRKTRGWY